MTIAACYLSPEGLVFGADSTSSYFFPSGQGTTAFHPYNHNQKVFQIGEDSRFGIVTWGLGSLGETSLRTMVARLGDKLNKTKPTKVLDVAIQWASLFWAAYSTQFQNELAIFRALHAKSTHSPAAQPSAAARTKSEEETFQELNRNLVVGFCLGGYVTPQRNPEAFVVLFEPSLTVSPTPTQLSLGVRWFGVPNLISRLMNGYDSNTVESIMSSGKWNGTAKDVTDVLEKHALSTAHGLPIRDAVDFVYTSIYSTIKAMKFSSLHQVCGGPIEIAVISTDREFRWVRHKPWDSAINEGTI